MQYKYRNDPKFSDVHAWANDVDPDQTASLGKQCRAISVDPDLSVSYGLITLWYSHTLQISYRTITAIFRVSEFLGILWYFVILLCLVCSMVV